MFCTSTGISKLVALKFLESHLKGDLLFRTQLCFLQLPRRLPNTDRSRKMTLRHSCFFCFRILFWKNKIKDKTTTNILAL